MKTVYQFLSDKSLPQIFTSLIVATTLFLSVNAQILSPLNSDFFGGRTLTGLTRSESVDERTEPENTNGKFTTESRNDFSTPLNFGSPFDLENQIFNNVLSNQTPNFAAGELDTSFKGGVSVRGNAVSDVLIQPDGKHLIIWDASGSVAMSINGRGRNGIARLNPDGTVDESFDTGRGFDATIHAMASATATTKQFQRITTATAKRTSPCFVRRTALGICNNQLPDSRESRSD